MAVLKQELTRTTFQDRQIRLMTDLYTEVRNLDKDLKYSTSNLKNSIISGVDSSIQGLYYSFVRYWETGTAAFISDISDLMSDLREGIDEDSDRRDGRTRRDDHQIQTERYQQYITNQRDTLSKIRTIVNLVTSISRVFGVSLDRYMDIANSVSDLQNIAVRNTGLDRREVVNFRDNISSLVSNMNERTNNLYSKVSSFELLIGLINQTGIKNLEFYEEYGELFITTQKTMNVNLGTLAEFANNFYRVYKFSSSSMEDLMESIRQNTAGTSTSEERLASFLSNVATDVRYFEYRTGGMNGLEDRTTASLDRMGGVYTWLRELGFDADDLFNTVLSAGRGGVSSPEYANIITSTGMRLSPQDLLNRLLSDPAGLMIEILQRQGRISAGNGLNSSALSSAYGYNFSNATQAEIMMNALTRANYENYMNSRRASSNAEADIFLSAEERIANATEDMGVQMSDLQESLGISLKTIYDVLEKILTAVVAIKGAGLLSRIFGGDGGSGGLLSRLFSGGATAGAGSALSGGTGGGLIGWLAHLLGSPLGKLGAVGLGAGLVFGDSLNNHGNDDLFTEDGKLTDLGRELGFTEADAMAYKRETGLSENAESKFNRLVGNRFGGALKLQDIQWAEAYYDNLRNNSGYSRKYILNNTPSSRRNIMNNILDAVEWEYHNGVLSDDLSPYTFYPIGTDAKDFDSRFTDKYSSWSLTPFSNSKWDGIPEASYAKGTPYLTRDQVALVHEGEAIVPAEENPFNKYSSSFEDRLSYLKELVSSARVLETTGGDSMKLVLNKLNDILTFIEFWKSDSESKDAIDGVMKNARDMNIKLQLVNGSGY